MAENVISVVAALIRDDLGRVLLVRKRGTAAFMQPGGKRDAGESDVAALTREIVEELGCRVVAGSAQALGRRLRGRCRGRDRAAGRDRPDGLGRSARAA
jgi:8-oxo-dGTP diphosphatase